MRKCKDRKILAMILAASMIFQSVPSVAIALEETTAAVSQNEEGKEAEQGKEQKAEEKTEQETSQETEQKQETEKEQESTQGDGLQTNAPSETETQPQTGGQAEQISQTKGQAETDSQIEISQESEAVNLGLELLEAEAGDKKTINSSEDFINLSNQDASTYQNAEITITRGAGVAFDLTKATSEGKTFQGFGSEKFPFKGTIKITKCE